MLRGRHEELLNERNVDRRTSRGFGDDREGFSAKRLTDAGGDVSPSASSVVKSMMVRGGGSMTPSITRETMVP